MSGVCSALSPPPGKSPQAQKPSAVPLSGEAADPSAPAACPVGFGAPAKKKQSWPPQPTTVPVANASDEYATDTAPSDGMSNVVVSSNIPKSGTDGTWDFPSPQRFYNAMKKKGYETDPHDISSVVSIHNTVNEKTWQEILRWEAFHKECAMPKLRKFGRVYGTPEELSPKSRMMMLLGYRGLFDRHDWIVDRCGKDVRYVIDFYRGSAADSRPSMFIDARPALDSVEAFSDRLRMFIREPWNSRTLDDSPLHSNKQK